jgi:hypothetical protein
MEGQRPRRITIMFCSRSLPRRHPTMGQTTPSDTVENHHHEVKHVASTAGRILKELTYSITSTQCLPQNAMVEPVDLSPDSRQK